MKLIVFFFKIVPEEARMQAEREEAERKEKEAVEAKERKKREKEVGDFIFFSFFILTQRRFKNFRSKKKLEHKYQN